MAGPDRPANAPAAPVRPSSVRAVLLLAVLAVLWGTTFPVVRMGVAAGADPFLLVTIDLAAAALALVPVAVGLRTPRVSGRSFLSSAGIGVVLVGGTNLFLFWGVRFATGGLAAIVFALTPLLAFLVLFGFGAGHRLGALAAAALAVGLAGVVALAYTSEGTSLLTNGWAALALFVGAACQATGAVLVGRFRPTGETLYGQLAQFAGGAAAAGAAVVVFGDVAPLPVTAPVLASVVYFVLLTSVVGYAVYFELLRTTGAVGANLVTYLNPVVALAIGVAILGEAFGAPELAGLALVLLALGLFERSERTRVRTTHVGPIRAVGPATRIP